MSNEDTSYRVGRGRPPRHSQFQKGRSGNPKGRPKAMKSADTILREQLAKKISIGTGASRRRVTTLEAVVMQLVRSGLKGDRKSTELMLKMQTSEAALPEQATLFSSEQDKEILESFIKKFAGKGDGSG